MAKKDGPVPWAWEETDEDRVVAASGRKLEELFAEVTGFPMWWDGRGLAGARRKWNAYVAREAVKL